MMSLTPLSTASFSRSLMISVCGVTIGMGKKALRIPYFALLCSARHHCLLP
jgi:hypothetical protein